MFAALWAFLWPGWDAIYPNLLASALCVIPSFLAHHLALRRHLNRLHQVNRTRRGLWWTSPKPPDSGTPKAGSSPGGR